MSYISTEAYNASVIYSFSELSPNDKFMLDRNGGKNESATFKKIKSVCSGITCRVTYKADSVFSAYDGNILYEKKGEEVVFDIPHYGEWRIQASKNGVTQTKTINITETKEYVVYFATIYGVQRNVTSSSPEWTRIEDSVGMVADVANGSVNVGQNDFDGTYPWSELKRVISSTGDVFVHIPEFYYKREVVNNIETIAVTRKEMQGFSRHPASDTYIAAYPICDEYKSKSGYPVQLSTQVSYPNYISALQARGSGMNMASVMQISAFQILAYIEFATNNFSAIFGISDYMDTSYTTGVCDNVANLNGKQGEYIVYRGLELYGGRDQLLIGGGAAYPKLYAEENPNNFSTTPTSYTQVSYDTAWLTPSRWAIKMGYDSNYPWFIVCDQNSTSGSSTTYYCNSFEMASAGENGQEACLTMRKWIFSFGSVSTTYLGRNLVWATTRLAYYPTLDTNNEITMTEMEV